MTGLFEAEFLCLSLSASSLLRAHAQKTPLCLCSNPAHRELPLFYTCTAEDCEKRFVCKACFETDAEHRSLHRDCFSNTSYLLESGLE